MPDSNPFPTHLLPEPLASFVAATSRLVLAPPEAIAFPALAAAGGAIGPRLALQLTPAWRELPTLWAALVAPAGSGKSAALAHALTPFVALHELPYDAWRTQGSEHVRRAFEETPAAFVSVLAHPSTAPPPLLANPRTWDGVTHLSARAHGLALVHNDLANALAVLASTDPSAIGQLRARWSAVQVHPTPEVRSRVLGLIGGLSPGGFRTLGRTEGLLESFVLTCPETSISAWPEVHDPAAANNAAAALIGWLQPLRQATSHEGETAPHPIPLDPVALAAWARWYTHHKTGAGQRHGLEAGLARKLPVQVARLALILHVLGTHPIPNGSQPSHPCRQ